MPFTSPIAVTEPEYLKGRAVFEGGRAFPAPDDEAGLAEAIRRRGARHAIVGVRPYRGPLYDALPCGGVLARFGVGHDGIDKTLGTRAGLLCTNTPGTLDQSVAEHTIALMLMAARRLAALAAGLRAGAWEPCAGSELAGKTLAVIGPGPIGRRVARIAAAGFGMRVVGCGSRPVPAPEFDAFTTDFAEAVAGADYVSLHIPSRPETAHYLGRERLALVPAKAVLVNTARGAVVDEGALYDALASGALAGAALDVFEIEPYAPVDPARDLRRLENAVMTPHVSSNTPEANRRMAERALRNIELAESGDCASMDLLNPGVL